MSRAYIIAVLILGVLVRVRCGQPTPAAGADAGQETGTPVVVANETVVEPTIETVQPTPEAVASAEATVPQATATLPSAESPRAEPSSTPTPALPEPASSTHTPWPTPVTVRGVITRHAMNVRAGPGTEFPILTMVFEGQEVTVVGKTEDEAWILILRPDGERGWAWREYIEVESSLEKVEVSQVVLATPTSAS